MQVTDLATRESSTLTAIAGDAIERQAQSRASKLRILTFVLAIIVLNALGNLALAWGMRHMPETVALDPLGYIRAMLNPFVALGIALLILWLLTRMALLSWADLTFVMPLTGVGYILTALLGKFFLNESISNVHWLGTLLIVAGTAIVGSTDQRTQVTPQGDAG